LADIEGIPDLPVLFLMFFPVLFLPAFVAVFLTTVFLAFAFFDGDLSATSFFAFLM